jgi:hypothetical protein
MALVFAAAACEESLVFGFGGRYSPTRIRV